MKKFQSLSKDVRKEVEKFYETSRQSYHHPGASDSNAMVVHPTDRQQQQPVGLKVVGIKEHGGRSFQMPLRHLTRSRRCVDSRDSPRDAGGTAESFEQQAPAFDTFEPRWKGSDASNSSTFTERGIHDKRREWQITRVARITVVAEARV